MPNASAAAEALSFWRQVLPKELGRDLASVASVRTGHHNVAKLTTHNAGSWFAKYTSPEYASQEQAVNRCLRAKPATAELVPVLVHVNAQAGLVLSAELNGHHPSKRQLLAHLDTLVDALVAIHTTPMPANGINYDLPEIDVPVGAYQAKLQARVRDAESRKTDGSVFMGLVHGDLNPDNVLLEQDQWRFLDWEFSMLNDVRWDLVSIATEFNFSRVEMAELIAGYHASARLATTLATFEQGVDDWLAIYLGICLGWCEANNQPKDKYWRYFSSYFAIEPPA